MQHNQIIVNGWTIQFSLFAGEPNKLHVESYHRPTCEKHTRIEHPLVENELPHCIDGNQWAELLRSCLEWKSVIGSAQASY